MPSNELFIELEDGSRSDIELWAELLDPEEMPNSEERELGSPNQARAPKGSSIGGQWIKQSGTMSGPISAPGTPGGSFTEDDSDKIYDKVNKIGIGHIEEYERMRDPDDDPIDAISLRTALGDYKGIGYEEINGVLRGTHDPKNHTKAATYAEVIERAIDLAPPIPPTVVFRGIQSGRFAPGADAKFQKDIDERLKPGSLVEMSGFQSTTTSPRTAWDFAGGSMHGEWDRPKGVIMKITTKRGLAINNKGENEILLQTGLRYRVKGREKVNFELNEYVGGKKKGTRKFDLDVIALEVIDDD